MLKSPLALACTLVAMAATAEAAKPPVYLWFEPEWFEGVKGNFSYWTDSVSPAKPLGCWGIAGPGISAEWTQGGESEWNSIGAPAAEFNAQCRRTFVVPRAGKYRIWVRYVDHRRKKEPFRVEIHQNSVQVVKGELGGEAVVPQNDEYQLYWGFSFGWGSLDGVLSEGPATLKLRIDKAGEAWRQVDAVLITDDLAYHPVGREKPPFAYLSSFELEPAEGSAWRGTPRGLVTGQTWKRLPLGGRDFSLWTHALDPAPQWWAKQEQGKITLEDLLFQFASPADIRERFHKQFGAGKSVPLMNWAGLLPGMYLGTSPDLSPGTPLRQWLERTRTPFFILTNYANPQYTEKSGPATYAALSQSLKDQFLGYVHGEAIGTSEVNWPELTPGKTRREHVGALMDHWKKQQAQQWSKIYRTSVPEDHWAKGISCLSVDSIALSHAFHEMGARVVGYEEDSTNVHVPMRIAFERGAARQYGAAWINYASGNFGDACNYFTQQHLPRGAPSWYHSKYAITDGVSASWYRKMYYLNFLGGASAIYWEQGLSNQYILPGPGTHSIQLSPFGRATEDFMAFVDRLPDRGEPYTPIGILLSYGHGYERVNYTCKMLNGFTEDKNDLELRELFNVLWFPSGVVEGLPAAPDVQSLPSGRFGNIFDVLVDRPSRARAIFNYPVIWAAGDVDLKSLGESVIQEYLQNGGTLVVNVTAAKDLPPAMLGVRNLGRTVVAEEWTPVGGKPRAATPFEVVEAELAGASVLAWAGDNRPLITRHSVGNGAVILTHCPRMLGLDERAHPSLPYVTNALSAGLLPVEVRMASGARPRGEIMHQLNRTRDGWLVMLVNNQGIDKSQHGVARVDRRQFVDVVLRTAAPIRAAREYTGDAPLPVQPVGPGLNEVRVRVHPGDVQVVYLVAR